MTKAGIRRACVLAGTLLTATCTSVDHGSLRLEGAARAALGARDGYVFVFSPIDCSLRQEQIDRLNILAARARRSGVILTTGPIDDSTAARAVALLGIRMRTAPLAVTTLSAAIDAAQLRLPLAIAIRHGRVIGVLAGQEAERLDAWVSWLENELGSDRGGVS